MTGQGTSREGVTPPAPPTGRGDGWRGDTLESWWDRNGNAFTEDALRSAALAAGHDEAAVSAAIDGARRLADYREAVKPVRAKARWIVLAAYGVVWSLFAVAFLGPRGGVGLTSGMGPLLLVVLTISLALALAVSTIWLRSRSPDPAAIARGMAVFLVVPAILLIGIAGLCVPFAGMR